MLLLYLIVGFPGGSVVQNPVTNGDVEDDGLIPGLVRSPGGENGNPLQYFCLGNPMDRGAWQATIHKVTKSEDTTEHACMHTNLIITQQIQSIIISVYNQYKNYWHSSHSFALSLKLECTSNLYWRRKWQPTPAFLPGKSQGLRILVGYSPLGSQRVGHNWATSLHFTSNLHTLIKTSHISIAQQPCSLWLLR